MEDANTPNELCPTQEVVDCVLSPAQSHLGLLQDLTSLIFLCLWVKNIAVVVQS